MTLNDINLRDDVSVVITGICVGLGVIGLTTAGTCTFRSGAGEKRSSRHEVAMDCKMLSLMCFRP